ncbi:DDE-type integrase/transposase/recombinase [Nonomuraea sp. KM90]|uniref:DDE-type integrase/transposase/recombinase n=1 Tax=Nonomuraea sp. KM90 TaxID=3457428 RepID=UPI003FCD544A
MNFTHVAAWCGVVYVAFVADIYSRAIVGWAASPAKHTTLVLDALDMALWRRERTGHPVGPGLIHHSDAGSQSVMHRRYCAEGLACLVSCSGRHCSVHSEEQARQVVDALSGRIYTALRDGGLDAEPVLELASSLEEWGMSTPATQELLERPATRLTTADLTRLGESLLRDTNFEPTFALEPRLWATLEHALKVVERDVRARGITGKLRLVTHDWDNGGHAWVEFQGDHHGNGISPITGRDPQTALAAVADAVQETIMELIWRVWPVCATHDLGLHAGWEHGIAIWWCTGNGTHTVAPVGELP